MGHLEATTETAATTITSKGSNSATATPSTQPHSRLKRSTTININSNSITTSRLPGISSSQTTTSAATTIFQPRRLHRRSMITINRSNQTAVITMICQPYPQKLLHTDRSHFHILDRGTFRAMRTPGSINATIIWQVVEVAVFIPHRQRTSRCRIISIIINSSSLHITAVTKESSTTKLNLPKHQRLRSTIAAETPRVG